ncbi:GNAT family N-acyltransferase [Kitasatospora sp. NPDC094015]|uniref:GNAT family N-acetyltransferase n=1 Tax=Kitasatospora sp. NPDC094015 TaxID=3155205 RepID=UPI00332E9C82
MTAVTTLTLPATVDGAAAAAPRRRTAPAATPTYTVSLARDEADLRASQRLRHQVFAEELGAVLDTPLPGFDVDEFDDFCDHLLVRDETTGEVVGTYRLLRPSQAAKAGRLYSDSEFDLSNLAGVRGDLVEVGRSCIAAEHRGNGAVINLMWGGIARYLTEAGHTWIAGCCSVPLGDGGGTAAGVWDAMAARHLSPAEYRVAPHRVWDPSGIVRPERTPVPALLRGYLRLGAWVCGEPAYDPDFNVADLFVLLSLERTDPRYLRHFLSAGQSTPATPTGPSA